MIQLKRRWRVMRRALPAAERAVLELAPALLAYGFDAPGLKADTPGVEGLRPCGKYVALARRLGLPNVISHQTGRRLAAAVLVLHEGGAVRILVEPALGISTSLVARVAERCTHATDLFHKLGVKARFELVRPGSLDQPTLARLYALGAVRCGRPSKPLMEALQAATVPPRARFDWAPHAPTAYCRVRLLLGATPRLEAPRVDAFAELAVLRIELLRALRRTPLFDRPTFRAQLSRELLPGRIPSSLLPSLREATAHVTKKRAPQLKASLSPAGVELSLDGAATAGSGAAGGAPRSGGIHGVPFASARTLLQARVRALLLAHALWGFVPDAWITGPQWKKLAQRLGTERARTTVLFALGPEGSALRLKLRAGKEPRMRELDASATLRALVASAAAGHQIEVVPYTQAQELGAMQLTQIAWRAAAHGSEPLWIEQGPRTLVYESGRFRNFATERFFARPRRGVPVAAPPATRSAGALGPTVECEAKQDGDVAVLIYRSKGWAFRERVRLETLATHLQSAMAICTAHFERPRFVLSLDEPLTRHLDARRIQSVPAVALEVRGDVTHGLCVTYQGETWAPRALKALAETILSSWQVGVLGQLDVRVSSVGAAGRHGEAITCLYARALIVRRLNAHIAALVGLKGRGRRDEAMGEG